MSASLVGSEMCIRDRHLQRPASATAEATASRRRCSCGGGSCRRQRAPVSYTHLTLPTICSV
eukprot:6189318-Alexandrium_andersonii.AAC.1